jgi:hypothetical protein
MHQGIALSLRRPVSSELVFFEQTDRSATKLKLGEIPTPSL